MFRGRIQYSNYVFVFCFILNKFLILKINNCQMVHKNSFDHNFMIKIIKKLITTVDRELMV